MHLIPVALGRWRAVTLFHHHKNIELRLKYNADCFI